MVGGGAAEGKEEEGRFTAFQQATVSQEEGRSPSLSGTIKEGRPLILLFGLPSG